MKKLSIILCVFFIVSCGEDRAKHDKKLVKDIHGNVYMLRHSLGVVYKIDEVDPKRVAELSAMLELGGE